MTDNPYQAPASDVTTKEREEVIYAGFWIRAGAATIDTIFILLITMPLLFFIYGESYFSQTEFIISGGWEIIISYVFPACASIAFWAYRSATPGKIILKLKIVDANHGGKPSTGQFVGRYFAYYLSLIPLMMGYIWVGFDKRKQGWHDKLAKTVVIKDN